MSRIKEVEKKIERYMDLYALGGIELSSIKSKIDPLMEEKKKLEAELEAKAEEKKSESFQVQVSVSDLRIRKEPSTSAPSAGMIAKGIHTIILINKIVVNNDQVDVYWNFTKS